MHYIVLKVNDMVPLKPVIRRYSLVQHKGVIPAARYSAARCAAAGARRQRGLVIGQLIRMTARNDNFRGDW